MAGEKIMVAAEILLQLNRNTADGWAANDLVLGEGEPALLLNTDGETPIGIKFGDGKTKWSELPLYPFETNLGEDGISPTVEITKTANGYKVSITDVNGTKSFDVLDGEDGYTPKKGTDYFDGKDGYTPQKNKDYFDGTDGEDGLTPFINNNGNWQIGDNDTGVKAQGKDGYTPQKGVDYFDGEDGYTPVKGKDYTDGQDGTSVYITGVTESSEDGGNNKVTFSDGKSLVVKNGRRGSNGTSISVSHIVESSEDGGENEVLFSDGKILTIKNGNKGDAGYTPQKNKDYFDGENGNDGISPTVNITEITGGHKVSITDTNGTQTFNVLNGQDGYTPQKGKDYFDGEKGDAFTYEDFTPEQLANLKGSNGYTPVRGIDYWNPDDIESINADSKAFIASELAKRGQLKPEFANDVSECTDTTKLYVLPDGYIYAYMSKTGPMFTNQVANAVDVDGTPYNGGLGYETGYGAYAIATAGKTYADVRKEEAGSVLTGLIPYNQQTVIRVSGYTKSLTTQEYIYFFADDLKWMDHIYRPKDYVEKRNQTFADESAFGDGCKTFTLDRTKLKANSSYYDGQLSKAKYIVVAITDADAKHLTVTFDEEIAFGVQNKWTNTGHAFVPADYEDRIIPLEESVENHEARIKTLELYGADSDTAEDIPAYIKSAANEVISKVIEKQGNRAFTMIGLSDFHYSGTGNNKDNLIRACKAISYINGRINVDAIATLGDNTPCGVTTDSELANAHRWFKEVNEILTMTQQPGIVDFRTPGNHDRMGASVDGVPTEPVPDNAIYSYIGGYNRQCDYVDVPGGWCYKDFNGYKLRVIVINTSEVEGVGRFSTYSGFHMSSKQYKWLIDTLDLSGKDDAENWQIVILSHHRADDYSEPVTNGYLLPNILNAYQNGTSYSTIRTEDGATISCNFAGKNQAKLIGNIHGHHHAYYYQKLYLGNSANTSQCNVMAISTPTTAFGTGAGHNDYNGDKDNGNSIKDTADETAFCVYSIDLDAHKIHAIHYGNGIDREISY